MNRQIRKTVASKKFCQCKIMRHVHWSCFSHGIAVKQNDLLWYSNVQTAYIRFVENSIKRQSC